MSRLLRSQIGICHEAGLFPNGLVETLGWEDTAPFLSSNLHGYARSDSVLLYRYSGRDFRLTDVHGHVVPNIIV